MGIDTSWQPRQSDLDWTANFIRTLNHNATWVIPMNQSVWRLNKEKKVFVCIHGERDDLFHRITTCCRHLDYTTEYAPGSDPVTVSAHLSHGTVKTAPRLDNPNFSRS